MNDKIRFIIRVLLTITLVAGFGPWAFMVIKEGRIMEGAGIAIVALIIAGLALVLLKSSYTEIKKGFPLQDERSKKLTTKSAAYAFYIGLYWLLVIMYYSDLAPRLGRSAPTVDQALSAGIAGMSILFGLSYLYLNRKGEE